MVTTGGLRSSVSGASSSSWNTVVFRYFCIEGDLETEFVGHKSDRVLIKALVDGHHDAKFKTLLDHISDTDMHEVGKVVDGDEFRDPEFSLFTLGLFDEPELFLLALAPLSPSGDSTARGGSFVHGSKRSPDGVFDIRLAHLFLAEFLLLLPLSLALIGFWCPRLDSLFPHLLLLLLSPRRLIGVTALGLLSSGFGCRGNFQIDLSLDREPHLLRDVPFPEG